MFKLVETPTIADGVVKRWKMDRANFEISSSKKGVMVQGNSPFLFWSEVLELIETLKIASREYERMNSAERDLQ